MESPYVVHMYYLLTWFITTILEVCLYDPSTLYLGGTFALYYYIVQYNHSGYGLYGPSRLYRIRWSPATILKSPCMVNVYCFLIWFITTILEVDCMVHPHCVGEEGHWQTFQNHPVWYMCTVLQYSCFQPFQRCIIWSIMTIQANMVSCNHTVKCFCGHTVL